MSHFYGTIQGQAGEATRRGSKNSGLVTRAASYAGCIEVNLIHEEGVDYAIIKLTPWKGAGIHKEIAKIRLDNGKPYKLTITHGKGVQVP